MSPASTQAPSSVDDVEVPPSCDDHRSEGPVKPERDRASTLLKTGVMIDDPLTGSFRMSTRVYIVKRTEIVIDLINRAVKACHASGIINPILSNVYSLKYDEGRLENINSARSFLARPFKFDRDTVIANVREISMGRFANTYYAPMGGLVTGTLPRDPPLVGHQSYRLKGAINCTSPVLIITSHDIAEFFALAKDPSQHPGHVCSELQLFADIRSDRENPIRLGEWLNYIHTIAMSCLQDSEAVLPELHGPTEQIRNILTTGDDDEHIALFNDLGAVRPLDTSEPDFDMSFLGHDEGLLPQGVHQSAEATQWRDWLSVDSPDRPSALVRDPQSGLPLDPNKTGLFPSVSLRTASTLDPAATTFQPPSSDRRYSIAALKAFTRGHRLEQSAGLTASAPAALQNRPASAHGSAVVQLRRGARTTDPLSDRLLAGATTRSFEVYSGLGPLDTLYPPATAVENHSEPTGPGYDAGHRFINVTGFYDTSSLYRSDGTAFQNDYRHDLLYQSQQSQHYDQRASHDWICPRPGCNYNNFARNIECRDCHHERPGGLRVRHDIPLGSAGDWKCCECGHINWRRRILCQRCRPHDPSNDPAQEHMYEALSEARPTTTHDLAFQTWLSRRGEHDQARRIGTQIKQEGHSGQNVGSKCTAEAMGFGSLALLAPGAAQGNKQPPQTPRHSDGTIGNGAVAGSSRIKPSTGPPSDVSDKKRETDATADHLQMAGNWAPRPPSQPIRFKSPGCFDESTSSSDSKDKGKGVDRS